MRLVIKEHRSGRKESWRSVQSAGTGFLRRSFWNNGRRQRIIEFASAKPEHLQKKNCQLRNRIAVLEYAD